MWLLILLPALIVIGYSLYANFQYHNDQITTFSVFLITLSSLTLALCLISFPLQYYENKSKIASFNATKSALEISRQHGNIIENAALIQKVIECNQWLARAQYYKSTTWRLWIPSEVLELKPIE